MECELDSWNTMATSCRMGAARLSPLAFGIPGPSETVRAYPLAGASTHSSLTCRQLPHRLFPHGAQPFAARLDVGDDRPAHGGVPELAQVIGHAGHANGAIGLGGEVVGDVVDHLG